MKRDVTNWTKGCLECARCKVNSRQSTPKIEPLDIKCEKFSYLSMDIVGPLADSHGYRYLLTIIDLYSAFPIAVPLREISSETILQAFLAHWVSNFGVPERIKTDRGVQFISKAFQEAMQHYGIVHEKTLAYSPYQNYVERLHRTIKVSLRAGTPNTWLERLYLALLSLKTSYTEGIKQAPSNIVYGTNLRLPGEIIIPSNENANWSNHSEYGKKLANAMKFISSRKSNFKTIEGYRDPALETCTHVFVRNLKKKTSLEPHFLGPFQVIEKKDKYFRIMYGKNEENININRIKPAFFNVLESQLPPPPKNWLKLPLEMEQDINQSNTPQEQNPEEQTSGNDSEVQTQVSPEIPQGEKGISNKNKKRTASDGQAATSILKKSVMETKISNMPGITKKKVAFAPNQKNIRESFTTRSGRKTSKPASYREE